MLIDRLDPDAVEELEYLVRGGRALVYPIYKGTWERRVEGVRPGSAQPLSTWRDCRIMMTKDFGRTIDYLESPQGHRCNEARVLRL